MNFQEASAILVSSHGLCTRMGKNLRGGRTWGDTVSYLLLWLCAPQLLWETTWKYLQKPQLRTLCGGRFIPRRGPCRYTDVCSPRTAYGNVQSRASGVPLQLVATYFLINRISADVIYPMMDPLQH